MHPPVFPKMLKTLKALLMCVCTFNHDCLTPISRVEVSLIMHNLCLHKHVQWQRALFYPLETEVNS